MRLTYHAYFYKDDTTDSYAVVVPDLPGCVSGGNTLADAMIMATDAASGWVLDELEDGKMIPPASGFDALCPDPGAIVGFLLLDMDAYSEKYGNKAVRKNLTIPAWLNTFAEMNHVNFSKVLQESLTEIYESKNA